MNDQATEATQAPTEKTPKGPRGPSPENAARLQYIIDRTNQEPGVASPTLAKELEISTLSCSQLTDRLVRKGEIIVKKNDKGVRQNYPVGYTFPEPETPAAE